MVLENQKLFYDNVSRAVFRVAPSREPVRTAAARVRSSANPAGAHKCAGLPTIDACLFPLEWHRRESPSLCLAVGDEPAKSGPGLLTPALPTVLPAAKQITGQCHSSFSESFGSLKPAAQPIT